MLGAHMRVVDLCEAFSYKDSKDSHLRMLISGEKHWLKDVVTYQYVDGN